MIMMMVMMMMIMIMMIAEELGYLVDAIINTGDISSFDSDHDSGNLSQVSRDTRDTRDT